MQLTHCRRRKISRLEEDDVLKFSLFQGDITFCPYVYTRRDSDYKNDTFLSSCVFKEGKLFNKFLSSVPSDSIE